MIVVRRARYRDPGRVQLDLDEVFRSLMPPRRAIRAGHCEEWRPPLEVYETAEALVVCVEIAGIDQQQVEVVVDRDVLAIRGERSDQRHDERRVYHEARISYGRFAAEIYLPFPVDTDAATATYENGFLRIELPRATARKILPLSTAPVGERGKE